MCHGNVLECFNCNFPLSYLDSRVWNSIGEKAIFSYDVISEAVLVFVKKFPDHPGVDILAFGVPHDFFAPESFECEESFDDFCVAADYLAVAKRWSVDVVRVLSRHGVGYFAFQGSILTLLVLEKERRVFTRAS
jgi:hypothetical protein